MRSACSRRYAGDGDSCAVCLVGIRSDGRAWLKGDSASSKVFSPRSCISFMSRFMSGFMSRFAVPPTIASLSYVRVLWESWFTCWTKTTLVNVRVLAVQADTCQSKCFVDRSRHLPTLFVLCWSKLPLVNVRVLLAPFSKLRQRGICAPRGENIPSSAWRTRISISEKGKEVKRT